MKLGVHPTHAVVKLVVKDQSILNVPAVNRASAGLLIVAVLEISLRRPVHLERGLG